MVCPTERVAGPTQADLEAIDFDSALRRSADRLKLVSDDPTQTAEFRSCAEAALIELYLRVQDRQGNRADANHWSDY